MLRAPTCKALVLAGGRSTRLGEDKGLICWHGKPQRLHLAELLSGLGLETFISCRADQAEEPDIAGIPKILDKYPDIGPVGGLLSAFETDSSCAWMCLACDLPLLDQFTIQQLIAQRKPSAMVTTISPSDKSEKVMEPLLAIWEPGTYPLLKKQVEQGLYSLRKMVALDRVHFVQNPISDVFLNVNTTEEKQLAMRFFP